MNVDLLITELEPGGAERCCTSLAEFLHRRGHGVRVISLGPRPSGGKETLVSRLDSAKIPVHFLNATRRTPPWVVRRRLTAMVSARVPDVAQGFLWHANWMGGSVYPRLSVPFFAGVRVTEPRWWRAWLSKGWIRRCEKVICVSQDVADWCHRVEGAPLQKLVVIPNGINSRDDQGPTFDPRSSPKDRVLLFVGRLVKQKGIDGLMSHAQRLLQELPEHQLVILGDGPMREWCHAQARAMDCSDRIHFQGQCDSVPAWMQHSEVLLHPARYEGMPNVVLEAMASGIPVVAFRVEGIRELLGAAFQEQTAPIGEWNEWLSRVVQLGTDATLRQSLGATNRFRAESTFRLDDQLARYLQVWSAALAKRN